MMDIGDKSDDKTVSLSLWSKIGRYDTMRTLIPHNVFVEESEVVPGLLNEKFPKYDGKLAPKD